MIDNPQIPDSPLCPRNTSQWLMPAVSAFGLSPVEGVWLYAGRRHLRVTTYRELCAVFKDGYIAGLCQNLVGDYVHVYISDVIEFPVTVIKSESKDDNGNVYGAKWMVSGGITCANDYRHHLVIHGGSFRLSFSLSMEAAPEIYHGILSTNINAFLFNGIGGVTFMNSHFEINGKVTFDDASERKDSEGRNNSPSSCTVNGENVSLFINCHGISLIQCSAVNSMEVTNV